MPLYEYVCKKCGRQFEELVFGDDTPGCPGCKAEQVERVMSVVARPPSEGAAAEGMPAGCGSCGVPGGPRACGFN